MSAIDPRREPATERLLLSFTPTEKARLLADARRLGIRLAPYVRSLVVQHLSRKGARK